MPRPLAEAQRTAEIVLRTRFPDADSLLLCGSVVRGESTPTSDLDLIVLFDHVDAASRTSFTYDDWPIECFCHDIQTARHYFYEEDRPSGVGALMHMVRDGIAIPRQSPLLDELQHLANRVHGEGPPRWAREQIDRSRYTISGLLDDLRGATALSDPGPDLRATAVNLYHLLATHYLRRRQFWSAQGKTILKRLQRVDPEYARKFSAAFEALFRRENPDALIELIHETIGEDGGYLFDGYTSVSRPDARMQTDPKPSTENFPPNKR